MLKMVVNIESKKHVKQSFQIIGKSVNGPVSLTWLYTIFAIIVMVTNLDMRQDYQTEMSLVTTQ